MTAVRGRRVPAIRAVALAAAAAVAAVGCTLSSCSQHSDDRGHSDVPSLSAADVKAGVVRVVYPDRSLPDAPEVATVKGTRVSLFLDSVTETGGDVRATLRVSVGAGSAPVPVRLAENESRTLRNVTITLVHGYSTGDPSTEAADVEVTAA